MIPKNITVLLVEDDTVDQMAVRQAFEGAKIANPIVIAKDGVEALDILMGRNGRSALAKPYCILLDINMPRMNGIEFLRKLRAEPTIHQTVVFVLTTSSLAQDRKDAQELNIAGYILKSNVGEGFSKLIRLLDYYWNLVELPNP